jgi:hypothetical protein
VGVASIAWFRQTGSMIRAAARLLLLRVLPRRILPIVTIVEAVLLIRSVRRRKPVAVNEPRESRTAPPVTPASAPAEAATPRRRC